MKRFILAMSLLSMIGCKGGVEYPEDIIAARDGSQIAITFYTHASVAFCWGGHRIYVDPSGDGIAWKNQPKADLVLITHDHYDHCDTAAVKALTGGEDYMKLSPGEVAEPFEGVRIEAVPAYNITEGHLDFHPRERGDAGYLITLGGTVIYVAGDTEDNDDVMAIRGVDIAFLPVNQPYTMTIDQCVRVVEAIRPAVFYPYHYGGVDTPTDVERLKARLEGVTDVRIRPLE